MNSRLLSRLQPTAGILPTGDPTFPMGGDLMEISTRSLSSGKSANFWIDNERKIGEFIEKNKISHVSRDTAGVKEAIEALAPENSPENVADLIDSLSGIAGGIRIPHFHYKERLYLLNQKQWKEFSGGIVKELSERLASSGVVDIQDLVSISNVVGSIKR